VRGVTAVRSRRLCRPTRIVVSFSAGHLYPAWFTSAAVCDRPSPDRLSSHTCSFSAAHFPGHCFRLIPESGSFVSSALTVRPSTALVSLAPTVRHTRVSDNHVPCACPFALPSCPFRFQRRVLATVVHFARPRSSCLCRTSSLRRLRANSAVRKTNGVSTTTSRKVATIQG